MTRKEILSPRKEGNSRLPVCASPRSGRKTFRSTVTERENVISSFFFAVILRVNRDEIRF